MGDTYKSEFAAGFMVGIGCMFYLYIPDMVVGAFMFSLALLTILYCKLRLFTGMIGSAKADQILELLVVFFNNLGGIYAALLLVLLADTDATIGIIEIGEQKIAEHPLCFFAQAILCGALMQTAVAMFRRGSVLGCVMCVAGFVLCGLEHSVANLFWLSGAGLLGLPYTLIGVAGNSLGAIGMRCLGVAYGNGGGNDG